MLANLEDAIGKVWAPEDGLVRSLDTSWRMEARRDTYGRKPVARSYEVTGF